MVDYHDVLYLKACSVCEVGSRKLIFAKKCWRTSEFTTGPAVILIDAILTAGYCSWELASLFEPQNVLHYAIMKAVFTE
jgi:hypothetical protein